MRAIVDKEDGMSKEEAKITPDIGRIMTGGPAALPEVIYGAEDRARSARASACCAGHGRRRRRIFCHPLQREHLPR